MCQIHFSDTGTNFHHLFALLFQTLPSSLFAPGHSILSYYRLKHFGKPHMSIPNNYRSYLFEKMKL